MKFFLTAGLTLLIFFSLTYLPDLGKQRLWSDEFFSYHAAKMILTSGTPAFEESGLHYNRARIYHRLCAMSMKVFGLNRQGSRMINIFFLIILFAITGVFLKKQAGAGNLWIVAGLFIMISSPFILAVARHTRMYTMFGTLFTGSLFLSDRCFFANNRLKRLSEINPLLFIVTLGVLLISYETHRLTLMLFLAVPFLLTLYTLKYDFTKKNVYLTLIVTVVIFGGIVLDAGTLNLKKALIDSQALDWSVISNYNPFYYVKIFAKVFPFFSALLVIGLIILIFKKNRLFDFLFLFFLLTTIFLSVQKTQQQRYGYILFVLAPILFIYGVYIFYEIFKNSPRFKTIKIFFITLIIILSAVQVQLFKKEIQETNTYTSDSIFIHKKLNFEQAEKYLRTSASPRPFFADWHAAFTLISQGFVPQKIILEKNHPYLKKYTHDPYMNIPLISKNDVKGDVKTVIMRDHLELKGYKRINETRPYIFKK